MSGVDRKVINEYITTLFATEDAVLEAIQREAKEADLPAISLRPFEGRLLQFLIWSIGAKKIVEIGTLAGYSGVWMARALPEDGKMYTLEKSSKHIKIAHRNFERAGLSQKVELLEGEASANLKQLTAKAPFDMVFIDADKGNYPNYLTWAVENLRVGGIVAAHNALRGGRILAPEYEDDQVMDDFNRALAEDDRLESTIISVGDGMAVGIKK